MSSRGAQFLVFVFVVFQSPQLVAHEIGKSYVFLNVYDQSMDGRIEVRASDLNSAVGLDANQDNTISSKELVEAREKILLYLNDNFSISGGEKRYEIEYERENIVPIEIADYVVVQFKVHTGDEIPDVINMRYGLISDVDRNHRGGLVIERNDKLGINNNHTEFAYMFAADRQQAEIGLLREGRLVRLGRFVREGVWHIWIGIDHVLFLVALILPSVLVRRNRRWQPVSEFRAAIIHVVKVITLFTVAHSITLTLSVLELVQLPSRLVESVIALSVVLVAINNVFPKFNERIWWLVFGFGLFHGFGFASVLMDLGLTAKSRAMSLFGFNLGVELGQLAIIFIIFPLLYWLRNISFYQPFVLRMSSIVIAFIASWWLVSRAFQISII
ncbi:MAG: HupE/UreJ family protein [Gammaproteobacteria bacterium]|nr:HupE/UreJ family protein [Gammaproteobacteria bacterium]